MDFSFCWTCWHDGYSLFLYTSLNILWFYSFWYIGIKVSFYVRQVIKTIQICNRLNNLMQMRKNALKVVFKCYVYFHLLSPYYDCKVINALFSLWLWCSYTLRIHGLSRLYMTHAWTNQTQECSVYKVLEINVIVIYRYMPLIQM